MTARQWLPGERERLERQGLMPCTSCQQSRGLRGISEDVMLALSSESADAQQARDRVAQANPLAVVAAAQIGGASSALGGAAIGFAAAGTGRGAATGALLSYGIESLVVGATTFYAGSRLGASSLQIAGGVSLAAGLAAAFFGGRMAYQNAKRWRRK